MNVTSDVDFFGVVYAVVLEAVPVE